MARHPDDLDRRDLDRLAAAYALDALDDTERAAFEAAYPADPTAAAEVVEFREVAARLAASQAAPPPAALRARVLAEVAQTRQLPPVERPVTVLGVRHRGRAVKVVLAAAAAVLLFVAGATLTTFGSSSPAFADQLADVMTRPDSQLVELPSTGAVPDSGSLRVLWSPAAQRVIVLGDGLSPGGDRVYELWLIDGAAPVPMGLLDPAADGSIRAAVGLPGDPAAWGVTLEPRGGSPAPTGDILFLGDVPAS